MWPVWATGLNFIFLHFFQDYGSSGRTDRADHAPADGAMSYYETLLAVAAVFISIATVVGCVLLSWLLMWKLFLSRFQFIREILNAGEVDADRASDNKKKGVAPKKKVRRD